MLVLIVIFGTRYPNHRELEGNRILARDNENSKKKSTGFEVGDSVLWEGHGQRKDLFSWVPGKVVEVLPRNAYRVESKRGNQSTMIVRTVNGDRLVSGPPATTESAESQQPPESPQIRRSARIAKRFTEKQNEPENQNNSTG